MALDRPLQTEEYLVRAVARANAIVVGRVVARRDTTAQRGPHRGSGTFEICRLRPERWIKGARGPGDIVAIEDVSLSSEGGYPTPVSGWRGPNTGPDPRARVIAFLTLDQLDFVPPPGTYLAAIRSVSRWSVDSGWSIYSLPGFQPWSAIREREVRAEAARQLPDSLIARAEAIIVARLDVRARGDSLLVETAMRGGQRGERLPSRLTWSLSNGVPRGGSALMLLHRAADGVYEPVSLDAGVLALDGERLPTWNCTLPDVRAWIARDDARRSR